MTTSATRRRRRTAGKRLRHIAGTSVLFAALSFAGRVVPASAQVVGDTSRVRLDTLRVPVTRTTMSAARAPVSLSLVGRNSIQDARPTIGLEEALASVPGLTVDNRQNLSIGSRVVIRGLGTRAAFGVRGVRILADGIPLTMPDGQTNLNNLDLSSAGSIHVLRGPASALFGNAAGGVIAVETEPAPGPRSAEMRVMVGDQGRSSLTRLVKVQAKVAETVGRLDYVASVSRLHADGFRDHGRARQTTVNAKAGLTAGSHTRLTFVLNAIDSPLAENPGALPFDSAADRPSMAWPANVARRAGTTTRQAQLGVRLQHEPGENARTEASVYVLRRSLDNPLPFAFIDLGRWAGGLRALHERNVGRASVVVGADGEMQRDERFEYQNDDGAPVGEPRRDQQDRVASVGPFVQARIDAGRVGLMAGARYDAVRFETDDRRGTDPDQSGRRTLHAPSVMLGATVTSRYATVYGNMATSFQTPTTTELLNAPPAPGEPCCPTGFNTELEPQRALSIELGARGIPGDRITWEAVGYAMNVTDALVPFQVVGVDGRDFFRNAGRTRHRGVELALGAPLTGSLSAAAAYTFTDVRFRDDGDTTRFEGNRVPGIAPHRLYLSTTWTAGGTQVGGELKYTASQFANDANTVKSDGYLLLDVRAQTIFALRGTELVPFIALNNVLNRQYSGSITVNAAANRYFEPAPGFNVVLGMSIRTGAWRRAPLQ